MNSFKFDLDPRFTDKILIAILAVGLGFLIGFVAIGVTK